MNIKHLVENVCTGKQTMNIGKYSGILSGCYQHWIDYIKSKHVLPKNGK
jgi:hypothetical protein